MKLIIITLLTVFPLFAFSKRKEEPESDGLPVIEVPPKESGLPQIFSPGAYFEEQQDALMYDTVFPLIYQYKAPDWLWQRELSLIPNCTISDKYGDSDRQWLCPIFHHIQTELKRQLDIAMGVAFMSSMQESDLDVDSFHCDLVAKHFFTERLKNDKFAKYLEQWKHCTSGGVWESDLVTEYSGKISSVYNTVVNRFVEEYYLKMRSDDRVNKAEELNEKVALAGLLYAHYLTLITRWRRGSRDCKLGYIPSSLLSAKRLQIGLDALERRLAANTNTSSARYKFTIPHHGGDISRYFKYPLLADCVYTTDKFYLRILIPATKVRAGPVRLVNIKPLPFYRKQDGVDQLCNLPFTKGKKLFATAVEEISGQIQSTAREVTCDSTNFKFCHIQGDGNDEDTIILRNPEIQCARALILYDYNPTVENEAIIHVMCPLVCSDLRKERMPIIVRAHDELGTIYAIGNPSAGGSEDDNKDQSPIEFKCSEANEDEDADEDSKIIDVTKNLPSLSKGLLSLILPCSCHMRVGARILRPPPPGDCIPDLVLFKMLPFHFAPERKVGNKTVEVGMGRVPSVIANTPAPVLNLDDSA